jgi:hypothetical protein
MSLPPSSIPSIADMEDFAKEYLGLEGTDFDLYYESYYNIDNRSSEDELNQTDWEY